MAGVGSYADPSRRIDLSARGADSFRTVPGRCLRCKGARPLLAELNVCKLCIIDQLAVGCDVVLPADYRPEEKQEDCIVCLQPIDYDETRVACNTCPRVFHLSCLTKWFKQTAKRKCPACQVDWKLI